MKWNGNCSCLINSPFDQIWTPMPIWEPATANERLYGSVTQDVIILNTFPGLRWSWLNNYAAPQHPCKVLSERDSFSGTSVRGEVNLSIKMTKSLQKKMITAARLFTFVPSLTCHFENDDIQMEEMEEKAEWESWLMAGLYPQSTSVIWSARWSQIAFYVKPVFDCTELFQCLL